MDALEMLRATIRRMERELFDRKKRWPNGNGVSKRQLVHTKMKLLLERELGVCVAQGFHQRRQVARSL